MKKIKVFTWHVHGSYLYYLSQANVEIFVPYNKDRTANYVGLTKGSFPWPKNLHEIAFAAVKDEEFDVILFQNKQNFVHDQYAVLSDKQRELPKIYIEHDPPREHPVDQQHVVDDAHMLLVHVTHFNNLMWNSNCTQTTVIEHGVIQPNAAYTGKLPKGIVMINNISSEIRGIRRMGFDIFEKVRQEIPLDIIGMGSKEVGGLGEISHDKMPKFLSQYRFFFNPIRYTSMGLSVIEAMMIGLPIVGFATTEMAVHIKNGYDGYCHTNVDYLLLKMQELIDSPSKAFALGHHAKKTANKKFNIARFAKDWEKIFTRMANKKQEKNIATEHMQLGGIV